MDNVKSRWKKLQSGFSGRARICAQHPEVTVMKGKFVKSAFALAAASLMAFAPVAFARDHGYYGGGYRGGYGYHGGYGGGRGYYGGRGHYDNAGRWIAGALVAGAVVGLVANASQPRTVVYDNGPTYYTPSRTVVYDNGPTVTRRVTTTTTYVDDGYGGTRYVRDDGGY